MEWVQFVIFLIAVFGLFVWNRTESRTDTRHMDTKLDSMRNLIDAIRSDSQAFRKEWMDESKDFHNRLCEIERRRKNTIGD